MGWDIGYQIEEIESEKNLLKYFQKLSQSSKEGIFYYFFAESKDEDQLKKLYQVVKPFAEKENEIKIFTLAKTKFAMDGGLKPIQDFTPLINIFKEKGELHISHGICDLMEDILTDLVGCSLWYRIKDGQTTLSISYQKKELTPEEIKKVENHFKIKIRCTGEE